MGRSREKRGALGCVVLAAFVLVGCESGSARRTAPAGPTYGEWRDRLGFAEAPVAAPDTPPGFVDFFTGSQVLEAIATDGVFVPSDDVSYSMIRVPDWTVDEALRTQSPVTLSLCDADHGIVLFHQSTGSIYHADPEGSTNCTPWIQNYEGRTTSEYHGGQQGVFGHAQVGALRNGNLYAGATMEERILDACGTGAYGNGGMLIGTLQPDPAPDDPLVETCVAPHLVRDGEGW